MQQTTIAVPSSSPTTSTKPSAGSTALTGIATLVIAGGFLIAASATKQSDVSAAGWILGMGAALAVFGALVLPAREPKLALILGGGSLLAGVLGASTGDFKALFAGLLAYAISVLVAKRSSTIGRIAGGIAAVGAISALMAKEGDLRDTVQVAMYLLAATSVLDAIAWFSRPRQSDAQRKPTMT